MTPFGEYVMVEKQNKSFVYGAMILTLANIVSKIFGAVFKIPLGNLIGAQGMGYFNAAYNIYAWFFVIATAGLPVALSKIISESYALGDLGQVARVRKIAMKTFLTLGVLSTAVLWFSARSLATMVGNPNAMLCIIAVAPTIMFVCIISAYRGYYQGMQNMVPSGISEVIISIGKLVFGYALAYYMIKYGYDIIVSSYPTLLGVDLKAFDEITGKIILGSAGAIFGVTMGTMISALFFIVTDWFTKKQEIKPLARKSGSISDRGLLKRLIKISLPITLGASVMSITNLLDLATIMKRLTMSAGFTTEQANLMYGNYSGFAVPLFNFPPTLIFTIGVSIIPVISAAFALKDTDQIKDTIESALRITTMLALPAAIGLSILASPILTMLYPMQPSEAAIAAPLLKVLALSIFFVCITSVTNAILQAMGHTYIPVVTMIIGGIIKVFANNLLIGMPEINISGAPISTILCYSFIAVANIVVIINKVKLFDRLSSIFIKPFIATLGMSVITALSYSLCAKYLLGKIHISLIVAICIGISGIIYTFLTIIFKGFYKKDINLLPRGKKLLIVLDKMGWVV